MIELEKTYNPAAVEGRWYALWEAKGYFRADEKKEGAPYAIVIPPPNITGQLTLGHVLNNTLQDVLIRRKRMQGFNAFWLPGTDHAGIATQNVVEKALAKDEKKTRHDLGREAFVKRVWAWREQYGSTIIAQLKRLGASCDWDRLRFTMDEGYSNAVKECFVRLYGKGLVYQGRRIINWCPRCRTALSDEENIYRDRQGKLWHIRYPLADGSGEVVVATTRPETMLGDTAVAVHPDDGRYQALIGKKVRLPLCDREIPVIADKAVEMEFGTGCVKVTPAHDPNDFAMGERHQLEKRVVMEPDGTMNENAPAKYRKLDRFACRRAVVADLEAQGFLVRIEDHAHAVGHCERCDTVTEPYLSKQWFVKYDPWVKPALEALSRGDLRFYPDRWEKTFTHWLDNIRDWCISRQLWWGHRIPVWYCGCGEILVSRETPSTCPRCGGTGLRQDEDVLDTWFSSWLWPLATMGWPEDTPLLAKYYPTSALITGPDIIFFWVARMVFAGLEFKGKLPFRDVYFTSIVRDMQGRKMSKSLGNSPDPVAVMDKYGADALRYTVIALAPMGQDVLFSEEKCEMGRHFANKLWNTARFILMHQKNDSSIDVKKREVDIWILSRYHRTIKNVCENLEKYNFNAALDAVYHFAWSDLCDWYVECSKEELNVKVFLEVFLGLMKLLHPFMPFITEEIYSILKENGLIIDDADCLMVSQYPVFDENSIDDQVERIVGYNMSFISGIRNLRAQVNMPQSKKGKVFYLSDDNEKVRWINRMLPYTMSLSGCQVHPVESEPPKISASGVMENLSYFLDLEGIVDKAAERDKIKKEIERLEEFCESIEKKLRNESFLKKAPQDVVNRERLKKDGAMDKIENLKANLLLYL